MPATPQKRRPAQRAPQGQIGRWKLYSLLFVSLSIVVTGFFFAGRLHFSSWDYSMKNSRLRKQVDDLETERRRLLLAREVAQSPNEIKRATLKYAGSVTSSTTLAQKSGTKMPSPAKDRVAATLTVTGRPTDTSTDGYSVVTASLKMPILRSKPEREPRKEQAE